MATTLKIVEQFNESIKHIKRAYESSKQGDLSNAQTELGKSSFCLYSSLEWSIKNYLINKYPDESIYPQEHKTINGTNFYYKLQLFKNNVSPTFESIGINSKIISDLKQIVRNEPEHSGYIPHFNSLVNVVEEVRKIIKNFIDNRLVLDKIPDFESIEIPEDADWSKFYLACDSFIKSKNYILIIGPTNNFCFNSIYVSTN